jgi:sorting nexin-7/30/sorting nexin-8
MSNWKVRQSLLGSFDNAAQDKIQKQQYLIDNIVNAGYDKQEFAEYMANAKNNGNDIDEWSLMELMDMVSDFQKEHQVKQKPKNDSDSEHEEESPQGDNPVADTSTDEEKFSHLPKNPTESNDDDKMLSQVEVSEVGLQEDLVKEVNTQVARTELSYLKKSQIKVEVTDGLVKKEGIFSFSYASYRITLEPLGYDVRRKEEDFIYLRKYLCRVYSNQYIPPLILTAKKLTEKAIQKKQKYFTKFLINVLRNKDLRGSDYLHEFLSIKDNKDFKTRRKLRDKEKEPNSVNEYFTSKGVANVSSSTNIWKFSYQMPEFIMNYTGINKNIIEVTKSFVTQVDELSNTVHQLGKYYEVLGEMYHGLDIKNMYQIHKFMSDILTCWGDTYKEQGQVMKDKFGKFFTYHTYEGEPLRELIKKRFNIKENYVKAELKLSDKKERLLKSQDLKKWELNKEGLNKIAALKENPDLAK